MSDADFQPDLPDARPSGFFVEQLLLPLFVESSADAVRSLVRLAKTQSLLTDNLGASDSIIVKLARGGVALDAATVVCTASGHAVQRDELAGQEQLLEAITQCVYALFSSVIGYGVYSETEQFWVAYATACSLYLGLRALPLRWSP